MTNRSLHGAKVLLAAELHQDNGGNDDVDQELEQRVGFLGLGHEWMCGQVLFVTDPAMRL